jgi:hypothetical protein
LKTTIQFNPRKLLFNNKYTPVRINIRFLIKMDYYLKIIKNRIINLINKHHLK